MVIQRHKRTNSRPMSAISRDETDQATWFQIFSCFSTIEVVHAVSAMPAVGGMETMNE